MPGGAPGQFLPAGSLATVALAAAPTPRRSGSPAQRRRAGRRRSGQLGTLGLPPVPRADPGGGPRRRDAEVMAGADPFAAGQAALAEAEPSATRRRWQRRSLGAGSGLARTAPSSTARSTRSRNSRRRASPARGTGARARRRSASAAPSGRRGRGRSRRQPPVSRSSPIRGATSRACRTARRSRCSRSASRLGSSPSARRRPRQPAVGAHLSGRLLDRHVRGRAVGHRARQRPALLAAASGAPAGSRPTSARPGGDWSRRTDRAAPATSSTPTSRSTCRTARPRPARRRDPGHRRRRRPLAAAGGGRDRAPTGRRCGSPTTTRPRSAGGARRARRRRRRARADELIAGYAPYNLADAPDAAGDAHGDVASDRVRDLPARPAGDPAVAGRRRRSVSAFPIVSSCSATTAAADARGHRRPDHAAALRRARSRRPIPTQMRSIPTAATCSCPDELQWMVDFDARSPRAWASPSTSRADQASAGFDRLLVLGLQLSATDADGAAALEELLHHHATGRAGLSLIPQGTPTHNTDRHRRRATPGSTTPIRASTTARTSRCSRPPPISCTRRDGQWLAEALGVDPSAIYARVHASGGTDQMRARAMQRALWPATLGYWMDKLLAPVFGDDAVDSTRWFFTSYVSGRGAVPAHPHRRASPTASCRPLRSPASRWLDSEPRSSACDGAPAVSRPAARRPAARAGRLDRDERAGRLRRQARRRAPDAARRPRPAPVLGRVLLALRREPRRAVQHREPVGPRAGLPSGAGAARPASRGATRS